MQTLLFNTTDKFVVLYEGTREKGIIIERFNDTPTVAVTDSFYEVRQKQSDDKAIPVLRVPIANTNMIIIK